MEWNLCWHDHTKRIIFIKILHPIHNWSNVQLKWCCQTFRKQSITFWLDWQNVSSGIKLHFEIFFALLCPLIIVMPDISIILLNGIDIYWLFANRNKIQIATNVTSKGNILKIVIYTAIWLMKIEYLVSFQYYMLLFRANEWVDFIKVLFNESHMNEMLTKWNLICFTELFCSISSASRHLFSLSLSLSLVLFFL